MIYDPLSYGAASGTRQPFPGSIVPATRINPVSMNLLKYYVPGTSLESIPSNVYSNPRNTFNDDQGGFRLDAALSRRSQLFVQIFKQNSPSDKPGLYPFSGLLYLNSSDLAMVQHVWSAAPRVVNTLRIGFLHAVAIGANEAQSRGGILSSIGISNTFETDGVTAINLQGYSSFGRANGEVGDRDDSWQLDEELTYTRSKHSFAFGTGLHYRRGWHLNGNSFALGTLSFQPAFTAQLAINSQGQTGPVANTGNSFADFLLGFPVTGTLSGLPAIQFRSTQVVPFVQDSWRVTRNLTLNYGVSWFLETFPDPQGWARPYVHGFNNATGLLMYAGLGQISPKAASTDKDNFAPRLGVAWKPEILKATVIRAGAGIYYSEMPWSLAPYPLIGGSPIATGMSFANSLTTPLPTYALGLNVFPLAPSGGLTSAYAASLPPGTSVTAINPNFRTAYMSQWNLALQHSAGRRDSIVLDYLGSSGHRLPNLNDPSQCAPGVNLFCNPATRPWPRYGLILYGDSTGNSSYEAFIAKYEHRAASGLNLRVEYTLAKALTDSYQFSQTIYNQITDCRRCSKGPATFDVRSRTVGSIVWEMPFGRGQRFGSNLPGWAEAAAGKWTLTAIATFATGQPVVLAAPNQTSSALINPLPNRVCDGRNSQLSSNIRNNGFVWFDTACFPIPPVGYFGNSGSTVLNGPGLNNWDLGVQKLFPVTRDAVRLHVRLEMFNAWNHPQFERPDSNAGDGANFGRISAARPPRLIQIALKIVW